MVGTQAEWLVPEPSGGCHSWVVGIAAKWWALQPSGGHQSQVVGATAEWWYWRLVVGWWALETSGRCQSPVAGLHQSPVVGLQSNGGMCLVWQKIYVSSCCVKQCQLSSGYTKEVSFGWQCWHWQLVMEGEWYCRVHIQDLGYLCLKNRWCGDFS